jgi:hypothetical protein
MEDSTATYGGGARPSPFSVVDGLEEGVSLDQDWRIRWNRSRRVKDGMVKHVIES